MAVLAGLAAVDWVVPFAEDTPLALIEALLPDVLVKGGDWKPDQIVGSDVVLEQRRRSSLAAVQTRPLNDRCHRDDQEVGFVSDAASRLFEPGVDELKIGDSQIACGAPQV